ncbi:hypothetical protein PU629_20450 [Pullulanibacillus sp. KACC 23026]|uniref:hypothetical protein n=1 Tax=Pullulanibacillus sp. KACC 23026 TaxID=3028315 RepID=UPI0023B0E7D1|nr:hypothetical protein [Pullulanibacillus sp. KACC 23026]WEG12440.1 hypothetical protein PU629_20450 [Pullulanibacillus sp. KACC 23026]
MGQKIGNVGVLNLLHATEESIQGIERIQNVGVVYYTSETAGLLTKLSIDNVGQGIEIPEGYSLLKDSLYLDRDYLNTITAPLKLFVIENVVLDWTIEPDQLKTGFLELCVKGNVYCPSHLAGAVHYLLSKEAAAIIPYKDAPPRIEKGYLELTNSYLQSFDRPQHLILKGLLKFAKDLDPDLFMEKVSRLEVKGSVTINEEQEPYLYKKMPSLAKTKVTILPKGYDVLKKSLRLNARSIRRLRKKKLYTEYPIILEADISREQLSEAITHIRSTGIIICHEQVEDLVFEITDDIETEVVTYENSFVLIEDDQKWSNDQLLALKQPTSFIVTGELTFDQDVQEDTLLAKIKTLDIFGEVIIPVKSLRGTLQSLIRINEGEINAEETETEGQSTQLSNLGQLTL